MAEPSALAKKYIELAGKYDKAADRILELTNEVQRLRASYNALNVVNQPRYHAYLRRRCELLQSKLSPADVLSVEVRLEQEGLL